MLTYPMDQRNGLPLYDYLYRCIRTDILSGVLSPGQRLPSKRQLAEHLQISVVTVEAAYSQLEAEGYLYVLPRRGFFVSEIEPALFPLRPAPELPDFPLPPAWQLDLRSNQVDPSGFPVSVWAKLTRQILSENASALLSPVPPQGLFQLRQAIAESLLRLKGMSVSPRQIVVGAGSEYLYLLLAQLIGSENIFAVEDPGYPKIRQVYGKCAITCAPVPLDQQGPDLTALEESGASVLHVSPSHQYPTGIVTSIARRQALLRWSARQNRIIIEDDYDSELRFTGRPIPTLQSLDPHAQVIYMNTFSQTISPSIRIGFLVLPPQLLERYRQELSFYSCTVPALEQHVLARFLAGGYYERHLARIRKEYRDRRAAVLNAFRSSPFAHRVSLSEQGAGLHFLLRLDTAESDDALRSRAEALGLRLGFLSEYAVVPRPQDAHTLVINYAGLDAQNLQTAITLLGQLL